jgi:hypothetical protein
LALANSGARLTVIIQLHRCWAIFIDFAGEINAIDHVAVFCGLPVWESDWTLGDLTSFGVFALFANALQPNIRILPIVNVIATSNGPLRLLPPASSCDGDVFVRLAILPDGEFAQNRVRSHEIPTELAELGVAGRESSITSQQEQDT